MSRGFEKQLESCLALRSFIDGTILLKISSRQYFISYENFQESLTEEDLAECRKVIFAIMSMEQKGESLPGPQGQPLPPGQGLSISGENKKTIYFPLHFSPLSILFP